MENRMKENSGTVYRLNRFFNVVLNPGMYGELLVVGILLTVWWLFLSKDSIAVNTGVSVCIGGLALADVFSRSPAMFSVDRKVLHFYEYSKVKPKNAKFVRTQGVWKWMKVEYSVSEFRNFAFHQNAFEKIFDTGRISFDGINVRASKNRLDGIEEKSTFVIYGIKNFSHFRGEFRMNAANRR